MKELEIITHTLEEHKGEEIAVVEVASFSPFADYYVLVTAQNPRALDALRNYVEEELEKASIEIQVSEGEPESGWMIVQGQDVIVHLFLPANRRVLQFEDLLERMQEKVHKA